MSRRLSVVMMLMVLCSLSPELDAALPSEEAILRKGGEDAKKIIEKAYSIIRHARVFTSRRVGDTGAIPTEGAWALTVITRYDPKAAEELKPLAEQSKNLETKLFAIAGLITLEPKSAAKYRMETFPKSLLDRRAYFRSGCFGYTDFFMTIHWLVDEGGWRWCTFEELPPFFETYAPLRVGEDP